MTDEIKPWDRLPDETEPAYEAFQVYLDLGLKRSLPRAAAQVGKNKTLLANWSSKYGWRERARQWDSAPRRALAESFEEMARRVAEQHEEMATALMAKLRENLSLLRPGKDPSVPFSTALGAARMSHQFAVDLSRPKDAAQEEIKNKIAEALSRLAGD